MGDAVSEELPLLEPRLPQELECIIFELAARSSRKCVLPVLKLVARRVKEWLDPLAYEIVVRRGGDSGTLNATGNNIQYVRHLLFATSVSSQETRQYLSQCPNVYNLALWSHLGPQTLEVLTAAIRSPLRRSTTPPLRRLSTSLNELFGQKVDFHHEVFRSITHLDVVDRWHTWDESNNFACLKELTHLAFNSDVEVPILVKCLTECKKLELLVVLGVRNTGGLSKELPKSRTVVDEKSGETWTLPEDRVVMNLSEGKGGWIGDWVRTAECGNDFWTRGAMIVMRRRRHDALRASAWHPELEPDMELGQWMEVLESLSLSDTPSPPTPTPTLELESDKGV